MGEERTPSHPIIPGSASAGASVAGLTLGVYGPCEHSRLCREVDVALPGTGEVRIAVKALGVNRAKALLRAGTYVESPTVFPSGLWLAAAGLIDEVSN